jgi:S1-C subfamily serine protease
VTVAAVTAGGPAETAGLKVGDVIQSVGGKQVSDPDQVAAAIQDRHPGDSIDVQVQRNGSSQTLNVKLGARPDQATP